MSTVAVYNGYGKYETGNDGDKGIALTYGGVAFWLPYKKVTYIPDYTFREVDHAATAAAEGEEGVLTYKTFRVSGERIVEEMLDIQIPVPNNQKGIIRLNNSKKTGRYISVVSGITEEGIEMRTEVLEVELTENDIARAATLSRQYKESIVQEYFQSKRERMAGGHGRLTPLGLTKTYMEELNIKDIDALPSQVQGNSNLEQLFTQFLIQMQQQPGNRTSAPQQETQKPAKVKEANDATGLV